MKLLHGYEDGNYVWVYPEPEFRDKDGYFTSNRWELLRQAIEVIVRGAERRRA